MYVFAVARLLALNHLTIAGALQTVLLLAMVWLVWVHDLGVANWLDPNAFRAARLRGADAGQPRAVGRATGGVFADRGLVGWRRRGVRFGRSAFTAAACAVGSPSTTSSAFSASS